MVIVDNNLSVIIDAIRNARVIVDNIRKVIYYPVSTSITEIVLISTSIFAGMPLPLLPIQILWINLVTDGVQDRTFPFIKEEGDVMNHPPKNPVKQFFDGRQIRRIMAFGLIMGSLGFVLFWYLLDIYSYEVAVSIMFTSVVCIQWCIVLQLTAIYVIPGVFGIVPLAPEHWRYVIALSLAAFFIVEAIKWLEYRSSHPTVRV